MNFADKNKNSLAAMILIALGVLALLGTLGVFRFVGDVLGALLFGGLAYFAYVEGRRRRSSFWRLAAFPLAGLAVASIAPWRLGSGAFLASLGLAFAVYWYEDRENWWALIPAGTLASLGVVAFFEAVFGPSVGWLFLVGMALTFFALTRLEVQPQSWAVWPAAGLGIVALMAMVDGAGWLVPLALIGVGAFLLLRNGGIPGISVTVTRSESGRGGGAAVTPPNTQAPAGPGAAPEGYAGPEQPPRTEDGE